MSQRRRAVTSPQRRLPNTASKTNRRYRSGIWSARSRTWSAEMVGRSTGDSLPPPLIWQGFLAMSPSSTAVLSTARRSRYAFAAMLSDTPAESSSWRHCRTCCGSRSINRVRPS
jgi:hypothetical protein